MRASGATTGKHYGQVFYDWADRSGFTGMTKEARWGAVDLVDCLSANPIFVGPCNHSGVFDFFIGVRKD